MKPLRRNWTYWAIAHVPGFWRLAVWWGRIGRRLGLLHPIEAQERKP